jgi:hypothetical protein
MAARSFDAIIIGAGAAGLMCALTAGQRGRRVALIEHTDTIGAKILISGGGRCNFTNLEIKPERFHGANPAFARSALARYTQHDFIALVAKHGIATYEKTLGQLFCEGAGAAKRVVEMLVAEARAGGVEIFTDCSVKQVSRADTFAVTTSRGVLEAPALVIATGGLSIPKIGATDFGLRMARQFDVRIEAPAPALVPLTFAPEDLRWMQPLSGVSLDAYAAAEHGPAFREGMLFTHRGLSGPAILQISSYWRRGEPIRLDLLPDHPNAAHFLARKRARPKAELKTILSEVAPARLAEALMTRGLPTGIMTDFKDAALQDIVRTLKIFALTPAGDEGYAKAEVMRGGVSTAELDQKTMQTRKVPGLFFIGETVDITGWLGGYNFQWAWSSGWASGQAL